MGNSAATLSPLQLAEITRQLKIEYEKCMADGLDNEAATAALTAKYNSVLKRVTESPLDIITSNAKRLKRGTSKAVDDGKPTLKRNSLDAKPKHTRHRSFESPPEKPDKKTAPRAKRDNSDSTQLGASESAPSILTDQNTVTNGDLGDQSSATGNDT